MYALFCLFLFCYHIKLEKDIHHYVCICTVHFFFFFLQEKGGLFSGLLKKSNKTTDEAPAKVSDKNGFLLIKVELKM